MVLGFHTWMYPCYIFLLTNYSHAYKFLNKGPHHPSCNREDAPILSRVWLVSSGTGHWTKAVSYFQVYYKSIYIKKKERERERCTDSITYGHIFSYHEDIV